MTILALLQNQWFKGPDGATRLLDHYQQHEGGVWEGRERFIRDMLFLGCLTGKRLRQVFGEKLCGQIIWEETSPQIGGHAGACFAPDGAHVLAALEHHRPSLLLCFGKVADAAIQDHEVLAHLNRHAVRTFLCCHPAARGNDTVPSLRRVAEQVQKELART